MVSKLNITGMKFGRLTALSPNGHDVSPSRKHILWACICDCGKTVDVRLNALRSGVAKSCGCIKKEGNSNRKHGMTKTPEYMTWARIKARCTNPKNQDFLDYGGRGIKMCESWLNSFENFFKDMGERPDGMRSIDRIDVNGDYCKENCRWATDYTQSRNKRNNRNLEFNGLEMCITDWSRHLGINVSTLIQRLREWPLEKALSTFKENQN
jgi:hypothetical protein